ncbi:MAG: hypothetical protein PVH19_08085 [Planctomycetia bacterium]|jgi:hypothetical protein
MGITNAEIVEVIQKARDSGIGDDMKAIEKLTIETSDGQSVSIGDIATVTMAMEPSHLIWDAKEDKFH